MEEEDLANWLLEVWHTPSGIAGASRVYAILKRIAQGEPIGIIHNEENGNGWNTRKNYLAPTGEENLND